MTASDSIDRIRADWAEQRPDLDSTGFALAGRILVLARHLERRVEAALAPFGLSGWAFDVLATLRRQGPPFRLTPTELSRATMLTSGAMTNRLDRLEAAGHVEREPDPADRRGVQVRLTPTGRRLVDRAVAARFAEAQEFAATLPAADRARAEAILRRLLHSLENR